MKPLGHLINRESRYSRTWHKEIRKGGVKGRGNWEEGAGLIGQNDSQVQLRYLAKLPIKQLN